ncbi:uncharacterized protein LOC121872840 [Homarus americanus]|uniref:uncharacterized protein LOC121872840 n=1 Tax=Homarus americanus TaxID=6706 RepID=UPI001C49510F|nr:uncharacterized protein LOC121872840 [Homarus americanus]
MGSVENEMRRKDHLIEELIKLHPSHGLNKVRGGDAEEALRSDLAAITVKVERLEQQLRDALASVSSKDSRVTELTRQLDAHRQEHARQAATIVTLRQKLQECARLRSEVLRVTEELDQREGEAAAARQTVERLVNELDDEKRTVEEQNLALVEYRKVGSWLDDLVRLF